MKILVSPLITSLCVLQSRVLGEFYVIWWDFGGLIKKKMLLFPICKHPSDASYYMSYTVVPFYTVLKNGCLYTFINDFSNSFSNLTSMGDTEELDYVSKNKINITGNDRLYLNWKCIHMISIKIMTINALMNMNESLALNKQHGTSPGFHNQWDTK